MRLLLVTLQHVLFHDVAAVMADKELRLLAQREPFLFAEQTVLVEVTYPEQGFSPPVFPVVLVVLALLRFGLHAEESDFTRIVSRLL